MDVIGKRLTIERAAFTIIGVAPAGFLGTEVGRGFDVAVPLTTATLMGRGNLLDAWVFRMMVRLRPDQSLETATATLQALQPQIREAGAPQAATYPDLDILKSPLTLLSAPSGASQLRRRYQQPLVILFGGVVLVLLLACANIATALLSRATARRHELSIHCALGASAWRLGCPLLLESVILSALGTGTGLLVAEWGSEWLTTQLSTPSSRVVLSLSPDWRVIAFTVTLSLRTVGRPGQRGVRAPLCS